MSQIHPTALTDGAVVGSGAELGPFSYVDPAAVVGDRVRLGAGARLLAGVRVEDDVVIGPNTVVGNASVPGESAATTIRSKAVIGANCSIAGGVQVGLGAIVSDGTAVAANVPPHSIVQSHAGRIVGYVDEGLLDIPRTGLPRRQETPDLDVVGPGGSRLLPLTSAADLRGSLVAAEWPGQIPFMPARIFSVFDVPSERTRGEHAHKVCEQFLVCLSGSIAAVADDGTNRREFTLDSPRVGLYLPPRVWCTQYRHTRDTVLLVLASHPYDESDYLRNYDDFLAEIRG
jgi:acetyltransferase-like isoleucine patch superfamily enzyme